MDFAFSDDQQQLREAARRLLAERLPDDRAARGGRRRPSPTTGHCGPSWSGSAGWASGLRPGAGRSSTRRCCSRRPASRSHRCRCCPERSRCPSLEAVGADPAVPAAVAWAEPSGLAAFDVPGRRPAPQPGPPTGRRGRARDRHRPQGRRRRRPGAGQLVVVAAAGSGGPAHRDVGAVPATGVRSPRCPRSTAPDGSGRSTWPGPRSARPGPRAPRRPTRCSGAPCGAAPWPAWRWSPWDSPSGRSTSPPRTPAAREQFGRVIGTYQAVSATGSPTSTSAPSSPGRSPTAPPGTSRRPRPTPARSPGPRSTRPARRPRPPAARRRVFACEALVQVLGGIGMTWEHVAHRLLQAGPGRPDVGGARPSTARPWRRPCSTADGAPSAPAACGRCLMRENRPPPPATGRLDGSSPPTRLPGRHRRPVPIARLSRGSGHSKNPSGSAASARRSRARGRRRLVMYEKDYGPWDD